MKQQVKKNMDEKKKINLFKIQSKYENLIMSDS